MSKIPVQILDFKAMRKQHIEECIENLPKNVTFKRVGGFIHVYDNL